MSEFLNFGEIMLRLKTPGHDRFFQSPTFDATFGGGEANVSVALANYGLDAGFVSALPANDIGESAVRELKRFGVDTMHIKRSGERVGTCTWKLAPINARRCFVRGFAGRFVVRFLWLSRARVNCEIRS